MENTNNIKSTYLTLFILSVIESVFMALPILVLLAVFFDIAIFIIIMIFRAKLAEGESMSPGIKFLMLSCIIHFISVIFSAITTVLGIIIAFDSGSSYSNLIMLPFNIIYLLILFASFVMMIISCVKIYKEYKALSI